MHKLLILPGVIFIIFSACKKEKNPGLPDQKPVIQIISPLPHASFNNGDTIPLKVQISDNNSLGSFTFDVYEADSAVNLLHFATTFGASVGSYSLDTFLVASSTEVTEYEVEAHATDRAGNNATEHLHCHIIP